MKVGWQKFLNLCRGAKSQNALSDLLELLLTIDEREKLAMRILIVEELLKEEKSQRQIAADLNISISKITRGSNSLKVIDKELREFLIGNL